MTVIPTGLPYWARTTSHTHYGGNVDKRNHLLQGVIDPETDVSAEQLARMASDLASIARIAPFAVMALTCDDTTPAAPSVSFASLGTGINTAGYVGDAPPSGFPTVTRVSDGVVQITFANSYTDDYSVAQTISVVPGSAVVTGSSGYFATARVSSTNVIRLYAWTQAGMAHPNATFYATFYSI